MSADPGTYALIMSAVQPAEIVVGRLGILRVCPGCYVYVGSALGPGGLAARLRHHLASAASPHWHIDYLRAATQIEDIWYAVGTLRHEHVWARVFAQMPGSSLPLRGFGASDCTCPAHLFFFTLAPSWATFRAGIEYGGPVLPRGMISGARSPSAPGSPRGTTLAQTRRC